MRSAWRSAAAGIATVAAIAAISAVLLELALRGAQALGVFHSQERSTEPVTFYEDRDPVYGIWHRPHSTYLARADCFEIQYTANSWGARDEERTLRSDEPRVAVLGDSFVEGVGAERGARMTDRLEQRTGVEHLNFGSALFSSTQQWLMYRELASRFDHDFVLLFMFPNNDFLENDVERFWRRDRYRPYLRPAPAQGGEQAWELFYPLDFEQAQRMAERQLEWNRWYNRLFVYRFVAWLDGQVRARLAQGETTEYGYVGYLNFDDEDLARLLYTYRKLAEEAAPRELVIFTIPRLNDLLYADAKGAPAALPDALAEFARQQPRIRYVDLLPGFLAHAERHERDLGDYFIPCDGHWSELGNEVAADLVLEALQWVPPSVARERLAGP